MFKYTIRKLNNQVIRLKEWYFLYHYKEKFIIPFDENWFKGKRIAFIGGADSAYKEKLGEYIDSFDVVVRVNNGVRTIEKYWQYIGKKTDFLFHTFYEDIERGGSPIEIKLWKQMNVKNIIFSHHIRSNYGIHLRNFIISKKNKSIVIQLKIDLHRNNMNIIAPYHPTTGLIAINTVLLSQPAQIYITGITFFRTAHHQSYRSGSLHYWKSFMNSEKSLHNPDEEYKAFKKLYFANQKTFKLDTTLQAIIDNDKH